MAIQIKEDQILVCLAQYPALGAFREVAPPPQSQWHGHNKIFRILCETGDFYLKALTSHPELSTEEHYEFQAWVMEHFSAIGVQTPTTLHTLTGRLLSDCAGYPAALSAAVTGDEFREENLAQQESAGWTLGQLHRRSTASAMRGRSSFRPIGDYLLRDASQFDLLPDISERPEILTNAAMLLERSHRIAQELAACGYHDLPRSAVHTDFTGIHLRVTGDRVSGAVDFEYASYEARILDLGRSLTQLFCIGREAEADGPERARAFLRGYNSAGWPLEERELRALPLAVKAHDFEVVTFPIYQMIETGRPEPLLNLEHRLSFWLMRVNWWEEHGGEVAEQLIKLYGEL